MSLSYFLAGVYFRIYPNTSFALLSHAPLGELLRYAQQRNASATV